MFLKHLDENEIRWLHIILGMQTGFIFLENNFVLCIQRLKNVPDFWPVIPLLEMSAKEIETGTQVYMHKNVHCNYLEPTQMSNRSWMVK